MRCVAVGVLASWQRCSRAGRQIVAGRVPGVARMAFHLLFDLNCHAAPDSYASQPSDKCELVNTPHPFECVGVGAY